MDFFKNLKRIEILNLKKKQTSILFSGRVRQINDVNVLNDNFPVFVTVSY